jgi:hypothetical protein
MTAGAERRPPVRTAARALGSARQRRRRPEAAIQRCVFQHLRAHGAPSASPLAYVCDGRESIGFVLGRGKLGHEALDREERSLGMFKTAAAAANAVFRAAENESAS